MQYPLRRGDYEIIAQVSGKSLSLVKKVLANKPSRNNSVIVGLAKEMSKINGKSIEILKGKIK